MFLNHGLMRLWAHRALLLCLMHRYTETNDASKVMQTASGLCMWPVLNLHSYCLLHKGVQYAVL